MSTIFGRKYSRGLLRLVSRRTRKRRNQRHQRSKGTKHCEQLLDKCRKIKGRQAQPHVTDNNRCIDSGCQCYLFMATIDVITINDSAHPPELRLEDEDASFRITVDIVNLIGWNCLWFIFRRLSPPLQRSSVDAFDVFKQQERETVGWNMILWRLCRLCKCARLRNGVIRFETRLDQGLDSFPTRPASIWEGWLMVSKFIVDGKGDETWRFGSTYHIPWLRHSGPLPFIAPTLDKALNLSFSLFFFHNFSFLFCLLQQRCLNV